MTAEQNKAAQALTLHVMRAVLETIREAGDGGAPCGPMYAAIMAVMPAITAGQFNRLLESLSSTGLCQRRGNVMYWIGPKIEKP